MLTKQVAIELLSVNPSHHLVKTYGDWRVYDNYSFELNFPNWENNPDTEIYEHYTSEDIYDCAHCGHSVLVSDDKCDHCGSYPHLEEN